jgi:hypothetical protein
MPPKEEYERLIVETPKFKIVLESLPPRTQVETHTHGEPFVILPIAGGKVEQLDSDGNVLYELDFNKIEPGYFLHMTEEKLPITHGLRNVSDESWHHLRIEY